MTLDEGTKLIAEFLGYKYYKKVLVDFSDCGGIYDWTDVYSKVPIEVNDYPEDEQCYFKDNFCRDNYSNYIFNPAYHEDWNQLFPVLNKLRSLETNWELRDSCCKLKTWYEGYSKEYYSTSTIDATYSLLVDYIKWLKTKNSEK